VQALAVLWLLGAVAGIGWVGLVSFFGDAWCERGDSNYGQLSWSVLPPGHTCTWTAQDNGFDATEGPGWQGSAYIIVMAVGGVTILALQRRGT
jgi:hypothetical protein